MRNGSVKYHAGIAPDDLLKAHLFVIRDIREDVDAPSAQHDLVLRGAAPSCKGRLLPRRIENRYRRLEPIEHCALNRDDLFGDPPNQSVGSLGVALDH
jgi:hypothetical protein